MACGKPPRLNPLLSHGWRDFNAGHILGSHAMLTPSCHMPEGGDPFNHTPRTVVVPRRSLWRSVMPQTQRACAPGFYTLGHSVSTEWPSGWQTEQNVSGSQP